MDLDFNVEAPTLQGMSVSQQGDPLLRWGMLWRVAPAVAVRSALSTTGQSHTTSALKVHASSTQKASSNPGDTSRCGADIGANNTCTSSNQEAKGLRHA